MTGRLSTGTLLRAVMLLQVWSLDLSRDAELVLGPSLTANLDLKLLLLVNQADGISPSQLVDQLGVPRSTVARAMARLRDGGLVRRGADSKDARRATLRLSDLGRVRVNQYVAATADTFQRNEATVKELMLLLGRDPEAASHRPVTDVLAVVQRMAAATDALAWELNPVMEQFGLSEAVDRAGLITVAEHRYSRPVLLGHELGLSPAGITGLLDRLVNKGLVTRAREEADDGRAVLVGLTPSGWRAARAYLTVFRRHQQTMVDALELTLSVGDTVPTAP